MPTKEAVAGKFITIETAFRVYPTPAAYFQDRVLLLRTLSRYKALFAQDDYKAKAMLFTKTGHCPDTKYGAKLTGLIEKYGPTRYEV